MVPFFVFCFLFFVFCFLFFVFCFFVLCLILIIIKRLIQRIVKLTGIKLNTDLSKQAMNVPLEMTDLNEVLLFLFSYFIFFFLSLFFFLCFSSVRLSKQWIL